MPPRALAPVDDVPGAFARTVVEAFADRPGPRFSIVLSGGPTARACYEVLSRAEGMEWAAVDVFVGDERLVPPDDADANQRLIREALLDRVGGAGSFSPMPTTGPLEECVAAYQRTMAAVLEGPGMDLIHLGMGPDGHTASLFPGVPELEVAPDVFAAATTDPNGRNPHPRLTLTLPAINAARTAVVTVSGESKAEAVSALLRGDDIPAGRIDAARTVWLVDAAALGAAP